MRFALRFGFFAPSSWKYLLFLVVDCTDLSGALESYFCFLSAAFEAPATLAEARLLGADSGAASFAGAARVDRGGIADRWVVFRAPPVLNSSYSEYNMIGVVPAGTVATGRRKSVTRMRRDEWRRF